MSKENEINLTTVNENDTILKQILQLLEVAEQQKQTDIKNAIQTLEKINEPLEKFNAEYNKFSNIQLEIKSHDKEISYLSILSNILYNIEEYNEALSCYQQLAQKLPDNDILNKAVGDCYRKLGQYDKALKIYDTSINYCKENSDDVAHLYIATLLNSRGLTYKAVGEFKKACNDFNEAIKLSSQNPLYFCNKGNVLYTLGDSKGALECFSDAYAIVQSDQLKEVDNLNKQNLTYINNTLKPFIKQLEALDKIELIKKDEFISARQNKFVDKFIDALTNSSKNNIEVVQIINTKENLGIIQKTPALYEYYDGFLFGLSQSYTTSVVVNKNTFAIDTSNARVDIATTLISLIPYVGDKIAGGIKFATGIIKGKEVKNAASNVCKFATTPSDFDVLAQDATVNIIMQNKQILQNIEPQKAVLPNWANKFSWIFKKYKLTEEKLYGDRNETTMQKFGYKLANDLVEKYIASGSIYENKPAITILPKDREAKLIEIGTDLIIQAKDENLIKTPNPIPCKCEIFTVYDIKYDNPILNYPDLVKYCAKIIGIESVVNLGTNISQEILTEAVNIGDYDLALAGLISLDLSNSITN